MSVSRFQFRPEVLRPAELLHRLGDRLLIGEPRRLVLLHGVEEMSTQFLPHVLSKRLRATDTPADLIEVAIESIHGTYPGCD